jgi:hypothetical protein
MLMKPGRGLAIQGGMVLTVPIQLKERLGLSLDRLGISQIGVLPNVGLIILMEAFHRPIALRMANWRKKEFGAHQQGQPDTLPQHVGMGKAAAKARFIIQLGVPGNTNSLPDVDQKSTSIVGPSAGIGLPGWVAGDHINGIETEQLLPPFQIMGHMVDLAHLMSLIRAEPRILNRWFGLFAVGHSCLLEDALNGADTGQRLKSPSFEPSADGSTTDILQSTSLSRFHF